MFISFGLGVRGSDKFIVEKSGYLIFLLSGDEIMADRRFIINDLLFSLHVKLSIQPFTKGQNQLSEDDVSETIRIARVCIQVERDIVPVSLVKKVDDILIVCFALVYLRYDLTKASDADFDHKEY